MSAFIAPSSSSSMAATAPPPLSASAAADERDLFISWLRGEFAAANAMIDLLLTHLRLTTGHGGEYEHVISAVHNRRAHWAPILHLQQYYPVADVAIALQHAAWARQQMGPAGRQQGTPAMPRGGRRFEHGSGYSNGNGSGFGNNRKSYNRSWSDFSNRESYRQNSEEGNEVSKEGSSVSKEREIETSAEFDSCKSTVTSQGDSTSESLHENTELTISDEKKITPKEFVSNELSDGKMVNAFEGLKVYEEIINISEVQNVLSWINETRNAGRRGELLGQTFITAKRPNKGHGREVIQLGLPIMEGPSDDQITPLISRERKVEEVPDLIQEMLSKLSHVITLKPDYCVIDFFNEGDHSHPSSWPNWYGRPVGTICLTECDMIFGRHIISDHKGDHRGPLELSLSPGSLIMVRTKGADVAKRAIPSKLKNRILLTFGKSLTRRPHAQSPLPFQQNVFVPVPVATAVAQVPVGPRVVLSGTGVFLPPPGSGQPPVTPANSGEDGNGEVKENGECNGEVVEGEKE